MSTAEHVSGLRSAPRVTFGVVLFLGWGIETFFWVYATIHSAADGDVMPVVTAVAAIALLVLLAGMEGLEVAVIDRWRSLYPERSTSDLAAWLAARQFFVALIVGLFDLTWTGFTVLWFAQIFPKHLAATNPDRYLVHLRNTLFPIVEVVRQVGVSQPGEWVASNVEGRLDWHATHVTGIEEVPPAHEQSLATIWRELIPESAPAGSPPPAGEQERPKTRVE
jgi:hypothetical protein